jgi:sugar-specific transcriptional regulator TrmB
MLPFMTTNQAQLSKMLNSLGLSDKETAVYLALLELGRGTVTQISRNSKVNRTNAYNVLNSLANQGLVRVSGKEPKQEYVAESPKNIFKLLNKRLHDTEEQILAAREYVPKLESIHRVEDRPQIKFYEGIEGLKQVYEDTLTAKEPIVAYAAYEDMHATLGNYFPSYYQRRAEKGISIRGIVPRTSASLEREAHNKEEKRDIAIIPKEMFDISPDIEIYDNKVMIASWREKLGIIIESAEVAHAMKKIFELAFTEAKRLDKESATAVQ